MQEQRRLLMVEDSSVLSQLYASYLETSFYEIIQVASLQAAELAYDKYKPSLVLLDIQLPDGNGLDFLGKLIKYDEPPATIVMTAHGTSEMAVSAIELGAFDFLTKPFDASRLKVTLDNAYKRISLTRKTRDLSSFERSSYGDFIGGSLPMLAVYKMIDALAATKANVFIVGESGTGKELAAEAIHQNSDRAKKQLIAINCGAIPSELMESELFGHLKGSFTGASNNREGAAKLADGGTLFLDEICEMSLELQKKLLRFIQTGMVKKVGSDKLEKVDVRFICATNKDPLQEVKSGRFREDLFYRLHVVPLRLPALRERGDDIGKIAHAFLKTYSKRDGKFFKTLSKDTLAALSSYPWPGNVRQLQNVMQQVVVLNSDKIVQVNMLPKYILNKKIENDGPEFSTFSNDSDTKKSDYKQRRLDIEPLWLTEKNAIEAAINSCAGNVNQAAGLLEVAPSTLYRKLQSWSNKSA
ncbi:sigma-54-dependent transcriptional regulator [Glaciecola petra]|uniref:Sigma-54 dependent transcriptional regulator n=1 Tax=Glaciecola petra TaxID=3075602 RepID=A0ABU2ZT57_9ALTE|nr:sigma-54 dependent transcriptional regulator [Aestuariibacter sp. P117]MDT0595596.1 sigma-54 dependent transcriptional regulator [Aestuariibacter sp. P117]